MYDSMRLIHLFAAFILAAFVLMYFASGFVMIFETFKRKDNAVSTVVKVVPGIRSVRGDTLISELKRNFPVSGQYQIRKNEGRTVIGFRHPGTEITVAFSGISDSVSVTTKDKNFVNVLHQFHRLHGYFGGWNYLLWAFFYDLSAISMIAFAFTGVYLWYKTERNKLAGWLILLVFTLFIAYTFIYLHYFH